MRGEFHSVKTCWTGAHTRAHAHTCVNMHVNVQTHAHACTRTCMHTCRDTYTVHIAPDLWIQLHKSS